MIKIVIFTANELRHNAFIEHLSQSPKIKILKSFVEKRKIIKNHKLKTSIKKYFKDRNKSERKFFSPRKYKNLKLYNHGYISSDKCLKEVKKLNPNLIIVYGSSIVKGPILKKFNKKIINAHLGLSPYYRGSGTNIFPIINKEPEYIGVTFMFLDKGIDTGKIIHQIKPDIAMRDNLHDIGNKLILKMFYFYEKLIVNYKKIKIKKNLICSNQHYYKQKDFDEKNLRILIKNMKKGIIKKYLKNQHQRDKKVKIVSQKWI